MPLKGLPIAPLTGLLDVRSSPDLLPSGSMRWRQNLQTVGDGKLRRGCGWQKLLNKSPYNNQDFHDQLLTFGGTTREPITMLCESESSTGIRSLWAATQSRIAKLNETTGNWKIMGSGFGGGAGTDCAGPRFHAAVSGDYMFFTNNFDRPKVHRLEQPPFDDELLSDIPDLETIGLSQAAHVWEWKDVVFFADVTMDGLRQTNRIVWGDYKKPMSFDPAKADSIAGYKDLNFGERILAGLPTSANTFLIYTTQGIWELSIVAGEQVFAWREAYKGKDSDFTGILAYENTLIDLGGEHLYLASDRPYLFSSYRSAPEPVEWLHRAASVLYDDLDDSVCRTHIGWVHGDEAFFSVKRNTDTGCPGVTLRINTQYKVVDVIDHGFTAACNFRSQPIPSIRDFILDNKICTLEGMASTFAEYGLGSPFENEGLPAPFATPSAAFTPETFYTPVTQEIEPGVDTEDWNQPAADAASLCALLGDRTLSDFCSVCEGPSLLVLASAQDWCLKQYDGVRYRERCVNPTAVGTEEDSVLPLDVAVDLVFVTDESGSMSDIQNILASVTADLEAQLLAAGIGNGSLANRYGSVAFGHGDPAEQEIAFTSAAAFATAAAGIGLPGGAMEEDGYEGIDFAITDMPWRTSPNVTKLIFLITDEDRNQRYYTDGPTQDAQYHSLKKKLVDGGFVLAAMCNSGVIGLRDGSNNLMIAMDYTGKCYAADGAGGYMESTNGHTEAPAPDGDTGTYPTGQVEEYIDLALAPTVMGYYFDLKRYRESALNADSLLAVIVPAMAAGILQNLTTVLYTSAVGNYLLDGYDSILRFAPLFQEKAMVTVERFKLNGIPAVQAEPSALQLRIGISGQTADPNDDRCLIVWHNLSTKLLKCLTARTADEHRTAKSAPALPIEWGFHYTGRNIFFEWKIAGTGGDGIFSGVVVDAKSEATHNF